MIKVGSMTLGLHVLDWKKDDFKAAFSQKDKKGNQKYNPDHLYKQVQEIKKEMKYKGPAKS